MTEIAVIEPQSPDPADAGEPFEPQSADAETLREYAISIRSVIPQLDAHQLDDLEAILVAVARRLRRIGLDAGEAEKTRTLAMQRYGALLGPAPASHEFYGNQSVGSKSTTDRMTQAEKDKRAKARLLDEQKEAVAEVLARPKVTLNQAVKLARQRRHEHDNAAAATETALVTLADCLEWLPAQDECDLLITDPPYSTDVPDVYSFANTWLPGALKKVKATGRAYICIGAYPAEVHAYLSVPCGDLALANILVWTYRNTLGPSPSLDYKLNWQAILYYRGPDVPALDCPKMTEQFSVQDINAPDGRLGDRRHAWQKPDELAERLIRHSTRPGDLVLDPFAGTGTFVLAAARLGRRASGCERDPEMLTIATERGCRET